jgi:hypothetical protein
MNRLTATDVQFFGSSEITLAVRNLIRDNYALKLAIQNRNLQVIRKNEEKRYLAVGGLFRKRRQKIFLSRLLMVMILIIFIAYECKVATTVFGVYCVVIFVVAGNV